MVKSIFAPSGTKQRVFLLLQEVCKQCIKCMQSPKRSFLLWAVHLLLLSFSFFWMRPVDTSLLFSMSRKNLLWAPYAAAKCSESYISHFVTRLSPFVPGNRFWYTFGRDKGSYVVSIGGCCCAASIFFVMLSLAVLSSSKRNSSWHLLAVALFEFTMSFQGVELLNDDDVVETSRCLHTCYFQDFTFNVVEQRIRVFGRVFLMECISFRHA